MSHQEPYSPPPKTILEHLEDKLSAARADRERALSAWQSILGYLLPLNRRKIRVQYDYQNVGLVVEVDVEDRVYTLFRCWVEGDRLVFEDVQQGERKSALSSDLATILEQIKTIIPAFLVRKGIYDLELLR